MAKILAVVAIALAYFNWDAVLLVLEDLKHVGPSYGPDARMRGLMVFAFVMFCIVVITRIVVNAGERNR